MAAPNVQILINAGKMRISWDYAFAGTYASYNVYWDTASNMAGEAKFASLVPNVSDTALSNKQVIFDFNRSTLPVAESTSFYVRIKGVSAAGVEDAANASAIKHVPTVTESNYLGRSVTMLGYDPTNGVWRPVLVEKDAASEAGKLDTV